MNKLRKIIKESVKAIFEGFKMDFENKDIINDGEIVGEFYFYVSRSGKFLTLTNIVIFEPYQNLGYGSRAMEEIIKYANNLGLIIDLTPEAYKVNKIGLSTPQLQNWYKSFGFVLNKGKNKDFETRNLMYKLPEKLN